MMTNDEAFAAFVVVGSFIAVAAATIAVLDLSAFAVKTVRKYAGKLVTRIRRSKSMTKPSPDLLPCPWCGAPAEMVPWHGGGPDKRMICCSNENCEVIPSVCGETPAEAIELWNTCAPLIADDKESKSSWLPISTAPKDGTPIWACIAHGYQVVLVFSDGGWRRSMGHKTYVKPTHWMPLPERPS